MKNRLALLIILVLCHVSSHAQKTTFQLQQEFAEWRFGLFMHFEMGTYTNDDGWANNEFTDPKEFNPAKMDCRQWASAAKAAGMNFALLTTRHHYGFSLWPTKFYDDYNVMHSSYKKDIVKEYVEAFREQGVKPCFYYSIWDKHHKVEKGSISKEDMDYIKGQLTELLSNYGEIPLLVIDGWAWQMGHKEVSYGEIRALVKKLQPNCLLIDHNGLTEMWEEDAIYFEEPKGIWCPETNTYASCQGMTITNDGWFWHTGTPNSEPMSVSSIVDDHIKRLEKRYCNFILNCPINRDGLLDDNIVKRLTEVGRSWKPDLSRPKLPMQNKNLEFPITPVGAKASGGNAFLAIDGISDFHGPDKPEQTLWETSKTKSHPENPFITLDLGTIYDGIDMLTYLPRQYGTGIEDVLGNIADYTVSYSIDGITFTKASEGLWEKNKELKQAIFQPVKARYIRLTAKNKFVCASEIGCGSYQKAPVLIKE
jgi:alpha-L-fucosidase